MKKQYTIEDLFYMSWEQLNPGQILTLIELSDMLHKAEPGTKEHGLIIINILRVLRKNKALVSKLELEQAVDCFNDITFFRRMPNGSFETPWYTFPHIERPENEYQRPEIISGLPMYNRSFQQLVYADSAFSAFCVLNHKYNTIKKEYPGSNELEQLEIDMSDAVCAMVAVLYTSPIKFDVAEQEERAKMVKQVSLSLRTLILHTYANTRQFITDRCPNLFPKPIHTDDNPVDVDPPTFTGTMWMNLRYDLAETDVFKGLETASNSRVYEALDYLEKKALEATKTKAYGKA